MIFDARKAGSMTEEQIARVAHEANRAMTQILQDVPVQSGWDEISVDMRASCVNGVVFAIRNPDAGAEEQHEAWCKERRAAGWVWGPTKDVELKLHPALRSWSELSDGVRRKDAVFRAIVKALL